jgi:DNA-binding HxlR family transcriptional regulator
MVKQVLELIGPQWATDVLCELAQEPKRYSDLQHTIGVTTNQKVHSSTLTAALDHLEERSLIEHHQPFYQLTRDGRSLRTDLLQQIEEWGNRHPRVLRP